MHGTARARRGTVAALALATLALSTTLSSCSGGGSEEPEADPTDSTTSSSTSSPSDGDSASPSPEPDPSGLENPVAFDVDAQTTFPEVDVRDSAVTDRMALTMTPDRVTARTLPSLTMAYELPADAGVMTDLSVDEDAGVGTVAQVLLQPGKGTHIGGESFTVTQFDLATGEVNASVTVDVAQDPSAAGVLSTAQVVSATDGTVVLDTWPGDPADPFGSAAATHTSVVVDVAAGKLAWFLRPGRPLAVQGDVVVVDTGTASRAGRLEGHDLAKGPITWTALDGIGPASLVGMTESRVLVAAAKPGAERATVSSVGLASGALVSTTASKSWVWRCFPSVQALVTCNVGAGQQTVGWDLRSNQAAWQLPTKNRFAAAITTVDKGVVYALTGQTALTLDPVTGDDVAVDIGAAPTAVSVWGGLTVIGGEAVFQPAAS